MSTESDLKATVRSLLDDELNSDAELGTVEYRATINPDFFKILRTNRNLDEQMRKISMTNQN